MSDETKEPQGNEVATSLTNNTNNDQRENSPKTVIDNSLMAVLDFLAKPWGQVFSTLILCNKFTVAMLGLFLVAGYLPAIEVFSNTISLYEQLNVGIFPLLVVAVMVLYALGVKRIVSKLASIALVLFVVYQLYEVYDYFSQLSGGRMGLDKRAIEMIADTVRYGLVLWVVSFIIVTMLSFLPIYKTNDKLWPALKKVVNTPAESNIDVQQYTQTINSGIQSAVSKGQASLKDADLSSKTKALTNAKGGAVIQKLAIAIAVIVALFTLISLLFSGNSAPNEKEVQQAFAKQGVINLGFVSGEITNVKLNDCVELEEKSQPTFECNIDAMVKYDLGGLGKMFGSKSGGDAFNESFNESFIFIQGSRGWYIQE
ncbi:hypothetical protein J8L70_13725 [Pseudoalteromonas sp. MMG010]|uniref:hypothetical protein n=1 Tax=Pseudoalteromonas sp. MMG010 TaxID=2822685 RepID=UPI001B3A0DF4|nr:hypothetical protein [Pseudoalteromonas sp. MMG010]MBQ4834307.1 hypothetical protein [Pseudoalteromonas sp. MMG010]